MWSLVNNWRRGQRQHFRVTSSPFLEPPFLALSPSLQVAHESNLDPLAHPLHLRLRSAVLCVSPLPLVSLAVRSPTTFNRLLCCPAIFGKSSSCFRDPFTPRPSPQTPLSVAFCFTAVAEKPTFTPSAPSASYHVARQTESSTPFFRPSKNHRLLRRLHKIALLADRAALNVSLSLFFVSISATV